MAELNWGMINDGGVFESLVHSILYARDPRTILFRRPGPDAGQDALSVKDNTVYQMKCRTNASMTEAISCAKEELKKIKKYRDKSHKNYCHWKDVKGWTLVMNFESNPNDHKRWVEEVKVLFEEEKLDAGYWGIEILEAELANRPEIREHFFEGENRVFIGLKEAYNFLANESFSGASYDHLIHGRGEDLKRIEEFTNSDTARILPIVGPPGIGKSRFVYEALCHLADEGWQVFWALPETMATSSRWYSYLARSRETCLVLDEAEDPQLLRIIVEQLSVGDNKKCFVIVTYQSEEDSVLKRYRGHKLFHKPLNLESLNEDDAKQVVLDYLPPRISLPEGWLDAVFSITKGVPGWLCLIGELAQQGLLKETLYHVDAVGASCVDICLKSFPGDERKSAHTFLRWLALFGTLRLEDGRLAPSIKAFMEEEGIKEDNLDDFLDRLVKARLVQQWGFNRRMIAVKPLLLQYYILQDWLFEQEGDTYKLSRHGKELIDEIIENKIPELAAVLKTLSQVARSYLSSDHAELVFEPFYDALSQKAKNGTLLDQIEVVELVKNFGATDPEQALDILNEIRRTPTSDEIMSGWLGTERKYTHSGLVTSFSKILSDLAVYVADSIEVKRYLKEFAELIAYEDSLPSENYDDRKAGSRLQTILLRSGGDNIFTKEASKLVLDKLKKQSPCPLIFVIIDILMLPTVEYTEAVSNQGFTLVRKTALPGSSAWDRISNIRQQVYDYLGRSKDSQGNIQLWDALAKSNNAFYRALFFEKIEDSVKEEYRTVLRNDLRTCAEILESREKAENGGTGIAEAVAARQLWSNYLKSNKEGDPAEEAKRCEQIYNNLTVGKLALFFSSKSDEDRKQESLRIADELQSTNDTQKGIVTFLENAREFFHVAQGRQSGLLPWHMADLAEYFVKDISNIAQPVNPLEKFINQVLSKKENTRDPAWFFALSLCKRVFDIAVQGGRENASKFLDSYLAITKSKAALLKTLFALGRTRLLEEDLSLIRGQKESLSPDDWFEVAGYLYSLDKDRIEQDLLDHLGTLEDNPRKASSYLERFIKSLYDDSLLGKDPPQGLSLKWVIQMITRYKLSGNLLETSPMFGLRELIGDRMSMKDFALFIRSRLEMDEKRELYDDLEKMPYHFSVMEWVSFDEKDPSEEEAFFELCELAMVDTFFTRTWIPKYLVVLDPTGKHIPTFVRQQLKDMDDPTADEIFPLGNILSVYDDDSEAWCSGAEAVCRKAAILKRTDRERVYFSLSKKTTPVFSSRPGEVADYFTETLDRAKRLNKEEEENHSPLKEYREWALKRAEIAFQREKQWAEEWESE